MTSPFSPKRRLFDIFEEELDELILTTYEYDADFIEGCLLPRLIGKTGASDLPGHLDLEEALNDRRISIIASAGIRQQKKLISYDVIPYDGIQHSKIWILASDTRVRIVISSVNLTKAAFGVNLEALCVLDFLKDCHLPRYLANAVLDYIERLANGRGKIPDQLREIRRRLDHMQLRTHWKKSGPSINLISHPNKDNKLIVTQLAGAVMGEHVQSVRILSPFFEKEGGAFLKSFIDAIGGTNIERVDICFPSRSEKSGKKLVWLLPAHADFLKVARSVGEIIHFFPMSTADDGATNVRDIHAKLIFMSTDKANYLLVGSSNFTKKGLGYKGVMPNAEANLIFRVPNPKEKRLRNFIPCANEKEIEFLKPEAPDSTADAEISGDQWVQIIEGAVYANGHLTLKVASTCGRLKVKWKILHGTVPLVHSKTWSRKSILKIPIVPEKMAERPRDLEIQVYNNVRYRYPIIFDEYDEIMREQFRLHISIDTLIPYWLGRVSRPRNHTPRKGENGGGGKKGIPETPDLLIGKVRKFVKALDGVRAYLNNEDQQSHKMLKNRIYGPFGVDKIFLIIENLEDAGTRLFCYAEMHQVIRDISSDFKDEEKKAILCTYETSLAKEILKMKHLKMARQWHRYLSAIGISV